jgi:hypothetical protein
MEKESHLRRRRIVAARWEVKMSELGTYLKTMGDAQQEMGEKLEAEGAVLMGYYPGRLNLYQLLWKHGKAMKREPLTFAEARHIVKVAARVPRSCQKTRRVPKSRLERFEPKKCYLNSQLLAIFDDTRQIRYHEGMVQSVIPIPHAWTSINGKVVDLTLRAADRQWSSRQHSKNDYFGVEIDTIFMADVISELESHIALTEMGRLWTQLFGEPSYKRN